MTRSPIIKKLHDTVKFGLATIYLLSILLTVPISFQLGGVDCGLFFTLTLFIAYFITTTLNIIAINLKYQKFIKLTKFLYYFQNFNIITILHYYLNNFENYKISNILHLWKVCLSYSTPIFTLLEGFFTILSIQVIGETNIWLTTVKNSNVWIITSLILSSTFFTTSCYYVFNIYQSPLLKLSNVTASLLSFTFSLVMGVAIFGIKSQNGSVIESSLFVTYIVCCIYEISPIMAKTTMDDIFNLIVNKKYHSINFSDSFFWIKKFQKVNSSIYNFYFSTLKLAIQSLSPVILMNLTYRVVIFYAATRIIPVLEERSKINHHNNNNGNGENDTHMKKIERRRKKRLMRIFYWYSPCILIAMYANLILQYSGELQSEFKITTNTITNNNNIPYTIDSWKFWNWCNIFVTMFVYCIELINGKRQII